VLCAAVDDALAGQAARLDIAIDAAGVITIEDDGPGMSVEAYPERGGRRFPEIMLTELHACRAARRHAEAAQRFCSAGLVVTNALSRWLELDIRRAGRRYSQGFERGVATGPLVEHGACDGQGTRLRFLPDTEIFGALAPDLDDLRRVLDEVRVLVPAVAIDLRVA
jgi:DNA gyrase/topoisomerase IV subunit B